MRGIHLLHPFVRAKAEALIEACSACGLPLLITDTLRTREEQDNLYAQGRTRPGGIVTNCRGSDYKSPHQWGVAFDFCKNIKGQEYNDRAFFQQVGAVGKSLGLFWGGDFKSFVDMPHFEDTRFVKNNSCNTLIRDYGTPEAFFGDWKKVNEIDETVVNLLHDGVASDGAHWRGFLYGISTTKPEYIKIIFDRYHVLLNAKGKEENIT